MAIKIIAWRIEWLLCALAYRLVLVLPMRGPWWWLLPYAGVYANTTDFAAFCRWRAARATA
jgi:hypothetical protein